MAVAEAMAVLRGPTNELGHLIASTVYGLDVKDQLFDLVKQAVMNEIGMLLFRGITPPIAPGIDSDGRTI